MADSCQDLGEPRYLGLDPGTRRIGVAISDELGIIASPLVVIDRTREPVAERLRAICVEYDINTIVVGLPMTLAGEEGPAAADARRFGAWAADTTGVAVEFADERYSTVVAEEALIEGGVRRDARRETKDKVAAAVMLQGYLNARRRA